MIKKFVLKVIDYIHSHIPVVRKIVPIQTFRYASAGTINLVYGIVQYWFIYHFILFQKDVDLGFTVISSPVFTLFLNFIITFFTGFYLVRTLAFENSKVRGHTQIFRYSIAVAINLCINYFGIKLFVETLGVYPTISNALIQVITINVSFLVNKHFTFKA